jgi:non-ribosomal peptide synthetase component E (peptide arylation enzyme)
MQRGVEKASCLTLLNPSMVAAYNSVGFWGHETMASPHVARERFWALFAVRARYRRMTYAALVDAADRLAACLAGHGVASGDRIAERGRDRFPVRALAISALRRCTVTTRSAISMS